MKIANSLVALCILQAWGASAFVTPTPKTQSSALGASYLDQVRSNQSGRNTDVFSRSPNRFQDRDNTRDRYSNNNGRFNNDRFPNAPNRSGNGISTRSNDASRAPFYRSNSSSSQYNDSTYSNNYRSSYNNYNNDRSIWDTSDAVTIQGGSLATLSLSSPLIERVQVSLRTEGRPLNANVDLWHGPDNTPQTMAVYVEDGADRPFNAVIETPRGSNSLAIRNTGQMEFPMAAVVEAEVRDRNGNVPNGISSVIKRLIETSRPRIIQGGAVHTVPFSPSVQSVQVLLKTDGRPLNARIELLQGPNNNKQVVEFFSEDGLERPFFAVIETPGVGNVVRVVNTATMEFPLTARVEAYVDRPGATGYEGGADGWTISGQSPYGGSNSYGSSYGLNR